VNVAAEAAVEPDAIVAPEPVEAIVEPEPVVAAVVSPSEPEGTPEEVGKEA
jgi:hypothetical protein